MTNITTTDLAFYNYALRERNIRGGVDMDTHRKLNIIEKKLFHYSLLPDNFIAPPTPVQARLTL